MTLNLQEMLSGAAIGDTRAIGVFLVCIHYGEDLGAQDENGSSSSSEVYIQLFQETGV